jgi:folate-binding protein YgfZ
MLWCEYPRDVVQVSGADATSYLHGQLSQDLRQLAVGDSTWSFLLQPSGRIDVLARVWRTAEDCYVLDTDAGFGEVMTARLQRFRIRVAVTIEPLAWRCLAVRGDGEPQVSGGRPSWGGGVDLLGPDPQPPAGAVRGDAENLLAARVAAVWPAMGAEIVPGETIPAETGIADVAVSFTKGCYPGQELVERMDSRRARPPRTLQRVTIPEGTVVAGDPLLVDGVQVGTITTVWRDHVLAYVHRNA